MQNRLSGHSFGILPRSAVGPGTNRSADTESDVSPSSATMPAIISTQMRSTRRIRPRARFHRRCVAVAQVPRRSRIVEHHAIVALCVGDHPRILLGVEILIGCDATVELCISRGLSLDLTQLLRVLPRGKTDRSRSPFRTLRDAARNVRDIRIAGVLVWQPLDRLCPDTR